MRTSNFSSEDRISSTYNGTYLQVHKMVNSLYIIWRFRSYVAPNTGTVSSQITFTNQDDTTNTLYLPTNYLTGAGTNLIKTLILPLNYKNISIIETSPPGA